MTQNGLGASSGLRRFAAPRTATSPDPERCALCGTPVLPGHRHLVDTQHRSLACACTACGLLFMRGDPVPPRPPGLTHEGAAGGRYRMVPDRVLRDPAGPLTDAEWASLAIPVNVAFFFVNSALGRVVASYPSPAGVTECELDLAAWEELAAARPLLRALAPDVEAILVAGASPRETFLVPIDACYSLAGALRLNWHGFDGGAEVREILTAFVGDLRSRARALEAR
ncbi:MAG TPA: DUF5947 family protein [Streptosporangiaceae bacterium]|nr:DUF5947 family protein [Streptosporangiaceae bacterium]